MSGFDAARRSAVMGDLLRSLKGRQAELLSFDTVREGLQLKRLVDRGRQEVPLDRIVGTLGRAREFNRAFLPRKDSLRERWREQERLARGSEGFPAIELYQVGDAYFVVDGHHRVSVARSLDAPTIEANVKEFLTPVPVTADDSVEDILLKSAYADFLAVTGLVPEEPDQFRVTVVPGYERLVEHINGHRYFLGVERGSNVATDEATESWKSAVYRPMIASIRASGVMADFPGRTETDLYLFTMDHLHRLRELYNPRPVGPKAAVRHFRWQRRRQRPWWMRWWERLTGRRDP